MSAPNVRKYTREQLLKCYRRFACPEGVEQHTAIYSLGTLLPEQLSPEPNYSQVLSVAPRAKRQISDLATRPRDPTNRAPVQVSHRPSVPGANGGRSYRGPPNRGWGADDDLPPGPRQPEAWITSNDSPSERFAGMQTWAADTSVGSRAPTSRVGRGLISNNGLRQPPEANSGGTSDAWNLNPPAGISRPAPVTSPHTAASWEKLGQKIATSPKIASLVNGKDLRSDLSTSPPPTQMSTMVTHHPLPSASMPTSIPEPEPSWMTELRRRFPKGLPEHVLQTLLGTMDPYTRGAGDVAPPSESSAGGDRFSSTSGASGLNFKDLLHKAHGAPPAPAIPPPLPGMGVVAASGMGIGEGPVIARVVRWSDNRPLYVVESISRAENLSVERANARHTVEYANDQYEARIILENYETRVAKLYQELLDMRRLWLPDPLAEHLGITDSTSIALWPSFRELFNASQSEGMSRKLQAWEARQAQRQVPPAAAPFPQPEPAPSQAPIVDQHSLWTEPPAPAPTIPITEHPQSPVMPPIPSPTQPVAPEPSTIPIPQTPQPTTWNEGNVHWWYLDPNQTIRGPYGSQKMFDWWQKKYFPPDLPVRLNPKAAFAPLSSLYPPELQSRHRPFLSPPPIVPQSQPNLPAPQQPPVTQTVNRSTPISVPPQTIPTTAPAVKASPAAVHPAPQHISPYPHPSSMGSEAPTDPPVAQWDVKPSQTHAPSQAHKPPPSCEQPAEAIPGSKSSPVDLSREQSQPSKLADDPSPTSLSPPTSQTAPSPAVAQPVAAKVAPAAKKKAAAPAASQIPERPQAFVQKHDTPALQAVTESRPMQSVPWARKKVAPDVDIDSTGVSALGPSLEESRFQDVMNRGGNTPNVGGAKAGAKKSKAKPKKQTLLEILSDQQADDMANHKSPWGMKMPPPTAVWGEPASKRSSAEASVSPVVVNAAATSNPAASAARTSAAPKSKATSTSPAPTTSAKASPTPIKQTPISAIVGQISGPPPATDTLNFSEPLTLNANQRKEISLLCAHHGIDLDADFLGVLAACETASDMNALLRDNLTVKDVQAINAFVEDFWDLVQNPFKPVKKGVTNTATPKAANKKRSGKRR